MQTYFNNAAPMSGISAGALLGTTGSAALINSINENLGGSKFFGSLVDPYREVHNSFIENFVKPIQQAATKLSNMINILVNPDMIRAITTEDQLAAVPPCMQEAIIMYPPVRKLLEEGRVYGFGYEPEWLPAEDVWGRLINNGVCRDVQEEFRKTGTVTVTSEWWSTDPRCSENELDMVEQTRNFIHRILETTMFDPTSYPEERG